MDGFADGVAHYNKVKGKSVQVLGWNKAAQNGSFAKEWVLENQANRPQFNALRERDRNHLIEKVGRDLRAMMSWIAAGGQKDSRPLTRRQVENIPRHGSKRLRR